MLTMSLDSEHSINPFDLEPGATEPSNDHVSFLKTLIRFMIGDSANSDTDLLDSAILLSIKEAYRRAAMRANTKTPTLSDVRDELRYFIDEGKSERVNDEAKLAATKLRPWVDDGMYAKLFDRQTTVDMDSPWLYFNIEQLKDDPKLETAMSLLIAYATTKRAQGSGNQRSIVILDECWSILQIESLAQVVEQLYRTARKRNAAVWGISQAIADFTGTLDKPNKFGEAILTTTAIKMIGRQKGNLNILRDFVHLNETTINYVKNLPMTEKGKKSEFLGVIGEKAESTFSFEVITTSARILAHDHVPSRQRSSEVLASHSFRRGPSGSLRDAHCEVPARNCGFGSTARGRCRGLLGLRKCAPGVGCGLDVGT